MPLEPGLIEVYTGDGKGKTTAALGLALRAVGQGLRVLIVQFMKNGSDSGEVIALQNQPAISLCHFGRAGFVNRNRPSAEDIQVAQQGWQYSLDALHSGQYDVIILDEVNVALDYGLLSLTQVLELCDAKPAHVELVLTGRNAHSKVVQRADLVTEMLALKHPYSKGVRSRKGIEY